MQTYTVTASVRLQCRGDNNRFLPAENRQYSYDFQLESPDSEYTDALFYLLEQDLPEGCRVLGGVSTTISPAAFAPPSPDIGEGQGASFPIVDDVGQLVTIYYVAIFDCGDGFLDYRTGRVDVPITATRDSMLDDIRGDIVRMMSAGANPVYDCTYTSFQVTAPAYYQYLTE